MSSLFRALVAAAILTVAGCGAVKPGDMALTSESTDAVILLQALPSPTAYMLTLASQNSGVQQAQTSLWEASGNIRMTAEAGVAPVFIARTVKPGRYMFHSFTKQGRWSLCFNRQTYSFKVGPGQVLYLGAFDPKTALQELQDRVAGSGNFVARGSQVFHYLDNVWLPNLYIPSEKEESLSLARQYIATEMPKVNAPLQPAAYQKMSFKTGEGLSGQKLCGGYYNEKPAERTAAQ